MIGHTLDLSRPLNGIVIGKIKYRVLVKFGNHIYLAVSAGCCNMLAESISVPAGAWMWHGGQQFKKHLFFRSDLSGFYLCVYFLCTFHQHLTAL
ncbi:hypothetical protein D3C86_1885450 [compost metagenome]